MDMRQKIAWKHVVNQKGNIYLMDEAEITYIVDFSKLSGSSKRNLNQMHLFHMIAIYAFPIFAVMLTLPFKLDSLTKFIIIVTSISPILLIDYLMMVYLVLPKNIREILEVKKHA